MERLIDFLSSADTYFGSGSGDGYGFSDGSGRGDGSGDGCGRGDGEGRGIEKINGMTIHDIDDVPTIIVSVKNNVAKGYTIRHNTALVPCYVARVHGFYGHGETKEEAYAAAQHKYDENRPMEDRIEDVVKVCPSLDAVVPNKVLYEIHHTLTGSCEYGRDEFAKAHDIDVENGSMTMRDFIDLTRTAYGGEVIDKLERAYLR